MSDAQIAKAMETYGVSPDQMARVVGVPVGEVAARVAATLSPGQTMLLGDTYVQPVYQESGSGENLQIGPLENVLTYKASENKPGGNINYFSPTGEYQQTTQQQKVDTSLGGAIKDIVSNPGFKIIAAAYGLDAALGAFGASAGAATGAGSAFELANAGASALGDLGAFELANAGAGAFGADAALGSTLGGTNLSTLGA